ncbi:glycosyltransferase involved in cell wall biosynthesis [Fluviicoccus keumensis]|uniref:Glycosyltransferase involved in cell wall biosynthesis n=1 Tax=Fluviicoccus keumensis TaxID=1435465 RepID=A0A4V6MG04_9GAMM|nr:glycosyltransferase family 4 protein [Fluviicoccus keumensis]RZU46846.1 glycosyltransferase involved in cell wall biosynthesis [Fluviicoccus keumensis]
MKILIVSQYFWPETFIINQLAIHLADQGAQVDVFTGKPNYPAGKIFEGYQSSGVLNEVYAGKVNVYRAPLRPRFSGRAKDLLLNYLSFVVSGLRYFPGFARGKEYDFIFVFATSPITAVIPAIPLKYKCNSSLVVWVQDLWPESLSATGFIKNRVALWLVGLMVRAIYFFADMILVQSKAFESQVAKYASLNKVSYYPNSIDPLSMASETNAALPDDIERVLRERFCLVFAGNIGHAQAVGVIIAAARKLIDLPEICFVLVGSGSMSEWVQSEARKYNLNNVILAGRYPIGVMSRFYDGAKGLLVTLKSDPVLDLTVPSKVQAYLASRRPILGALNGEGARVIVESGGGLVAPADDPEAFVRSIRAFYAMSDEERDAMGAAGHRYFENNFDMKQQVEKLVELFKVGLDEGRNLS